MRYQNTYHSLHFLIINFCLLFLTFQSAKAQQVNTSNKLQNPNTRILTDAGEFGFANSQEIPNLVGHMFHIDTIERILDGTSYVLGESSRMESNKKSGLILRQTVRNDRMLDGIIPIDVVYAIKREIVDRDRLLTEIPEEIAEVRKVDVPSLIDMEFNHIALEDYLKDHDLQIGRTTAFYIDINTTNPLRDKVGKVVLQDPETGEVVDVNSPVDLWYGVERRITGNEETAPGNSAPPPPLLDFVLILIKLPATPSPKSVPPAHNQGFTGTDLLPFET